MVANPAGSGRRDFISKYFRGEISVGDTIRLYNADKTMIAEFKAQGVDTLNRKYIEVWG